MHVLTRAWEATTQEWGDVVIARCENKWHRIVLSCHIDLPDVVALMEELGIETVVLTADRDPT